MLRPLGLRIKARTEAEKSPRFTSFTLAYRGGSQSAPYAYKVCIEVRVDGNDRVGRMRRFDVGQLAGVEAVDSAFALRDKAWRRDVSEVVAGTAFDAG